MKKLLAVILSLGFTLSAAATENRELYHKKILDDLVIGESQRNNTKVLKEIESQKSEILQSFHNDCSSTNQWFDTSGVFHSFLPLNHHGPEVTEIQYAVELFIHGACVKK